MARITYDFSEVPTGAGIPTGWQQRFDGSNVAYEIVDDLTSPGLQAMEIQKSGAGRNLITLDAADGDDQHGLILVESDDSGALPSIWINASGSSGNESGYLMEANLGTNQVGLWEANGGGFFNHDTDSITLNANTGYWMRLIRLNSGEVKGRMWEEGTREPTTWNVTATDSTHTTGFCGAGELQTGTFTTTVHWYSVGTDFESACSVHAADFPDEALYYSISNDDSVRITDFDGSPDFLILVTPGIGLQQVDWHRDKQKIYTTQAVDGTINRYDRYGLNEEILVTGLTDVFGITFDYANSLMYYVTRQASGELYVDSDDGGAQALLVSSLPWPGHPWFHPGDGFIYVPLDFNVRSYDAAGALQVTYPTDTGDLAHWVAVDDDNVMCGYWNDSRLWWLPIGTTVGPWNQADNVNNIWMGDLKDDLTTLYGAAFNAGNIYQWDTLPPPDSANRTTILDGLSTVTVHSVAYYNIPNPDTEIVDDYLNQAGVKRTKVRAKLAKLSGTGTHDDRYWVIDHTVLPAGYLDSDLSTAEVAGAPTTRMSTSYTGLTRMAVEVVDFSPASGGVGGGATAEIYVRPPDANSHDVEMDVWIWWGRSGKTQPAASAPYGSQQVRGTTDCAASYTANDFSDASANGNDGVGTGVALSTDIPFGSIQSYEFDSGSTDRVVVPDDNSLDLVTELTVYMMFKTDSDNGTFQALCAKRLGVTNSNYSMAFDVGGNMDFNYINGGFVGVSADFSTFWSVGNWEFVAGTMKQVGADVVCKLFNRSGEVATNTVLNSTLLANNDTFDIGNVDQSTWAFPLDGRLKGLNVLNHALELDEILTVAENFSDVADFWEFGFAVEEGPFDGSNPAGILVPTQGLLEQQYSPIFTSEICGLNRNWTFQIHKFVPDGETAPTVTSLPVHESLELEYGPASIRNYVVYIPSIMTIDILDRLLLVYNEMKQAREAARTDYWYYGSLASNDGVYTWRGWVKIGLTSKFLSDKRINVTQVELYDGLGTIKSFPVFTPHKEQNTIHQQHRDMLSYTVQPLGIKYLNGWEPSNVEQNQPIVPRIQLVQTAFQDVPRSELIDYEIERDEAYQEMNEMMLTTVWQGLDGYWHVKQLANVGRSVAMELYDYAAVDENNLDAFDFAEVVSIANDEVILEKRVDLGDFDEDAIVGMTDEVGVLNVIKSVDYEDEPGANIIQLCRNFRLHDWYLSGNFTGLPKYIRQTSATGTLTQDTRTGGITTMLMDTAGAGDISAKYHLGYYKFDQDVYFRFDVEWGAERNGGASTVALGFRFVARPYDGAPDAESAFLDASGNWVGASAAPGWLASVAVTPDANGANPITLYLFSIRTLQRLPLTGVYEVEVRNVDLNDFVHVNKLEIFPVDSSGNDVLTHTQEAVFLPNFDKSGSEEMSTTQAAISNLPRIVNPTDVKAAITVYGPSTALGTTEIDQLHPIDQVLHAFNGDNLVSNSLAHARANETALAPFIGLEQLEGDVRDIISPEQLIHFEDKIFVAQKSKIQVIKELSSVIAPERLGGGLIDQAKVFYVGEDEMFYTINGDFTETATGLDLSAEQIIDIDYQVATRTIWGLSVGGSVYSWPSDGSEAPTLMFTTAFSDFETIHFDNLNSRLLITRHEINFANRRWYGYSLGGTVLFNWEARIGLSSIGNPAMDIGTIGGVTYGWHYGLGRLNLTDGVNDFMQSASGLNFANGTLIDTDNVAYRVIGSAVYQYNPVTVNNPTQAFIIGGGPAAWHLNARGSCDWFEYNGVKKFVGCGNSLGVPAGKAWSFNLATNMYEGDISTVNPKCLCTNHAFATS